jgi:RimJ/RimL family protein N-acetyltransferase
MINGGVGEGWGRVPRSACGWHDAPVADPDDGPVVTLREAADGERAPDSSSEWDDWGPMPDPPHAMDIGRMLVVADSAVVGSVSWHPMYFGPTDGSMALEVGISLAEPARGRGIGSLAQRLLADHLFATTEVERVQASTDVANLAERRSLEKAGFTFEGVLRQAQERADGRHDLALYSRLRFDP